MAFYHSTDVELSVGDLLIPTDAGFVHSKEVSSLEDLFESVRPSGVMARSACSYLVASLNDLDGAGGREGAVYEVEPIGDVQWSDLAWYTEAQMALDEGDVTSATAYAESYWMGELFPMIDQRVMEGRCRALKITSIIETPEDDAIMMKGASVMDFLKTRLPFSEAAIEQLLSISEDVLIARGKDSEHATENPDLEDGTVAIWGYGEPNDFSIMVLATLSGDQLKSTTSSEAQERIKQHPSYARYRELSLSGSMPPPIHACQSFDGSIRSANRRRLLVAQEVDTPLRAWVESLNADTTVVTYGQFKEAVNELREAMNRDSKIPRPGSSRRESLSDSLGLSC